jgi:hypothetical protein
MLTLTIREVIPAVVLIALGTQIIFASFFISILVSGSKSTSRALRESHADEKREREEAVARLQAEYNRIQGHLDAMDLDTSGASNSHQRPVSNWKETAAIPSQGKMANWLRSRNSNPKPCG